MASSSSLSTRPPARSPSPARARTARPRSPAPHTSTHPGAGAAPMGSGGALLLGGTLVAAGSSGLTFIDTSSLKVTDRSVPGWDIAGVGLSSDGKTLYAVNEHGRVAVISAASHQVTAIFDPSAGTPMAVMRVSA